MLQGRRCSQALAHQRQQQPYMSTQQSGFIVRKSHALSTRVFVALDMMLAFQLVRPSRQQYQAKYGRTHSPNSSTSCIALADLVDFLLPGFAGGLFWSTAFTFVEAALSLANRPFLEPFALPILSCTGRLVPNRYTAQQAHHSSKQRRHQVPAATQQAPGLYTSRQRYEKCASK